MRLFKGLVRFKQLDSVSVEDAIMDARHSSQDDNIDKERVEQHNKSTLTK